MERFRYQLNKHYHQRFGLGLITALSAVFILFQWTLWNDVAPPVLENGNQEMQALKLFEKQVVVLAEKQANPHNAKEVADNTLLKEEISFKDPIFDEPSPEHAVFSADSTLFTDSVNFVSKPNVASTPKPAPKVEPVKKKVSNEPHISVELMPAFGGCPQERGRFGSCTENALLAYIGKHYSVPSLAKETGVSGRVIVEFVIETDGTISNAKVLRSPGAGLGEEAIRVINEMPIWKPGSQQGMFVRVICRIPIQVFLE